ncbi:Uncharacterised protein [Enterobacter hormaechei]|nr:Uncharacterised protein [Enterobacter hormaechei]
MLLSALFINTSPYSLGIALENMRSYLQECRIFRIRLCTRADVDPAKYFLLAIILLGQRIQPLRHRIQLHWIRLSN